MRSSFFKLAIFLLLLNSVPILTFAQNNDSLLVQLGRKWENAKIYTLQMAELMPAEYYDFKPTSEQMSFGEQILHISENILTLSSKAQAIPQGVNYKNVNAADKAAVIKAVNSAYDVGLSAHKAIPAARLDDLVNFFAGPMSKRQILIIMHDHQTHHIGQLIVYLRLKSVKPVSYIGW